MLSIHALPALSDNYIWLIAQPNLQRCAVVDPGAAEPVQQWLEQHPGWQLEAILITHHHADHTAGLPALRQTTGAKLIGPAALPVDQVAQEGSLSILGQEWQVLAVPGHTLDHLAYWTADELGQPWLFCGDTLFSAGCGRLFEGTAAQMLNSLQRLNSLPPQTRLCCAHEYTLANLRFAQAVEPHNPDIQIQLERVTALRAHHQPSLPSTLAEEHLINPFLRLEQPSVQKALSARGLEVQPTDLEGIFAHLREWKNNF